MWAWALAAGVILGLLCAGLLAGSVTGGRLALASESAVSATRSRAVAESPDSRY